MNLLIEKQNLKKLKEEYLELLDIILKTINSKDLKITYMVCQNINYFSLSGNFNVKHFLLREKINNNPNLKTAIDQNIIKQGDIVLTETHFIVFNGIVEEDSKKAYSFIDSLCFYYKLWKDDKLHNNCKIHEKEGIVNAFENSPLINTLDSDELKIGKLEIIDR